MALREGAASVTQWAIAQRLPRTVLRLAMLRGDPLARLLLQPDRRQPTSAMDGIRHRGELVFTSPGLAAAAGHAAANSVLRSDAFGVGGGHGELPPLLRRTLDRVMRERARGPIDPPSMLAVDPPQHTRYRKLVSRAFTARQVRSLEERVTGTATRLLDELQAEGVREFDLVTRYASLLPVAVIGDLLGVREEDQEDLLRWGDSAALLLDPGLTWRGYRRGERAVQAMADWFAGHVHRLRADPGEDLLSRLAALEGDDALDELELRAVGLLVLGAGFETTVSLISNAVMLFGRHPRQLETVREDPALWENAVDEVLRHDSPVQLTLRTAYQDTVVEGVEIPRGQSVVVLLAGANRDPAVFDAPHVFDVTRKNASEHLAFSAGVHYCLGASLARLEGAVGLRLLYERFPGLRPVGRARRRETRVLRGYAHLPVTVT
ncbi:cytochrome P450 [Streptomyces monticola]|uniref:Cytochrome P450 n=1 Tax=Streptomyces monticola TaxID=2666263 RepID=A0ABW2JP16_9ACTN